VIGIVFYDSCRFTDEKRKQKTKGKTKGQAQRLISLEKLVNFVGRLGWVGNSFWREQDDDFEISVGGFSIMDNHLHFLLRIDVERASQWSAIEVAKRWMALLVDYTSRLVRDGKAAVTAEMESIFTRLGSSSESWGARMLKLSGARSLGRFMSAS